MYFYKEKIIPTVNIYIPQIGNQTFFGLLHEKNNGVREFLAKQLSCSDRTLKPEEISVRVIEMTSGLLIAESHIEIEITAAIYQERVDNQDKICTKVAKFFEKKLKIKKM